MIAIIFSAVGLLLIFLGWLIRYKKCYNLLAGVNTATEVEKLRMNLPKIGSVAGGVLIPSGLGWILTGLLCALGFEIAVLIWIPVFIIGIFAMVFRVQRYDGNNADATRRKKTCVTLCSTTILVLVIFGVVGWLIFASAQEPGVYIDGDRLVIDCVFGIEIKLDEINSIELVESVPLNRREWGSAVMGVCKGRFTIDGIGTCGVYLHRDVMPCIRLNLSGDTVFIGVHEPLKTRDLYEEISSWAASAAT